MQCSPPIRQLHSDFGDFNNGVYYIMKITIAKRNPDMGLLTQQTICFSLSVPAGSFSRGGDVTVYVKDVNQPSLHVLFFLFCSCVHLRLYSPFNCISFNKFSRQLSVLSLCSSGLISALLVLLTSYLVMKVSSRLG